ncbi:MAG: glutamine synthetase beta-grasp domain-containing protein [Deltaproteobacteria bacterium]|jgi:glutamine synthetase
MAYQAEYIWIDGTEPTPLVRSKTRIITDAPTKDPGALPQWQFDGSSTNQAPGRDSDCILEPVRVVPDPVRGGDNILVLCEVHAPDGTPHASNRRALLRAALDAGAEKSEAWVAFEQEYTFFDGSRPMGFPAERRFPAPQGPYYCGVGADEVYGREIVEEHTAACMRAGLSICGINAEVMPGQWEFQIGGPGVGPLEASDHLWLARWLLYRVGENFDISATLDPKPVPGDWNGAGMHTNYSTAAMRIEGGRKVIEDACEKLRANHEKHLAVYGHGNEGRLTGLHETCSYREFRWGVADRTASIRIPRSVATDGFGYLEDRRPAANADPYNVCNALLRSTLDLWP